MFRTPQDLYNYYDAENKEQLAQRIYKQTACGAGVELRDNQVRLTSIVEGSDAEVASEWLTFPIFIDEWRTAIQDLEDAVSELWSEANDTDQ